MPEFLKHQQGCVAYIFQDNEESLDLRLVKNNKISYKVIRVYMDTTSKKRATCFETFSDNYDVIIWNCENGDFFTVHVQGKRIPLIEKSLLWY